MDVGYIFNSDENQTLPPKIPRPANAFMIYANENRKRMSQSHPQESNKDISKRLGLSWKALDLSEKKKYFDLAKNVEADHKKRYPDYVYNPKEARIRKAMREASRERAAGTAPIPSPRGGRRSQTWTSSPEEQLMMTPSPELGGPICSSPIFPGPAPSVGQFMQPINSYAKLVHVLPSTGWLHDSPTYLQHNPIAELQQHQANMWHQYQEPIRPCTGPTYMLDSQINLYQDVNPNDVLPQRKCKSEVDSFASNAAATENVPPPPKSDSEKVVKNEKVEENEDTVDDAQTLVDSRNLQQTETFLPVFQETVVVQNPFDKDDDMKLKKKPDNCTKTLLNDTNLTASKSKTQETVSQTADANSESFIKPPECPLRSPIPSYSGMDVDHPGVFKNPAECETCRHDSIEEKFGMGACRYLAYPFTTAVHDHCNLDMLLLENLNPNLIYTDVGVIPMYDNNTDVEQLLHSITSVCLPKRVNDDAHIHKSDST